MRNPLDRQLLCDRKATKKRLQRRNEELVKNETVAAAGWHRYREHFEHAPDAYLVTTPDGVIVEANLAAESLLGIPRALLAGKPMTLYIADEDQEAFQVQLNNLMSERTVEGWNVRIRSHTGGLVDASVSMNCAPSGDGTERAFRWLIRRARDAVERPSGELETATDTGRRERRAEAEERKRRDERDFDQGGFLRQVVESLTHPFYILDARDHSIKMANPATGLDTTHPDITCYSLMHGKAMPCSQTGHSCPAGQECPVEIIKRTRKPVVVEHLHRDRYGNSRNVEVHAYPVFDNRGNVSHVIEYAIDITERKKMEQALQDQADKVKLFAFSISHDLKSPVIGVYGLAKLLYEKYSGDLDEKGRKYFDQILKASRQALALVEEINAYASAKEAPISIERVSLRDVLRGVRQEFSQRLRSRQIRWIEEGTDVEISADRLCIFRIFRNLVENALKYGGDKLSRISVRYEESPEFHILSVSDNGAGIDRGDIENIFCVFQRRGRSRNVDGTGLGLAIVKEIAERHRGRVWVESEPGAGATFYVSISKEL